MFGNEYYMFTHLGCPGKAKTGQKSLGTTVAGSGRVPSLHLFYLHGLGHVSSYAHYHYILPLITHHSTWVCTAAHYYSTAMHCTGR